MFKFFHRIRVRFLKFRISRLHRVNRRLDRRLIRLEARLLRITHKDG